MGGSKLDFNTLKETPPWEWPEGAGEVFLRVLRDKKAKESDRLLAAEFAGDMVVVNDEIVAALISIVQSGEESEGLRAQAAIALGPVLEYYYTDAFEDPDELPISEETFRGIQESLHELYLDQGVPKDVRRRILEASVRAPEDWHRKEVLEAFSSEDDSWRLTAVFCMRCVQGFHKEILEALEDENEDIEYQAVCAAGIWEVDAAWPHVSNLVVSEETDKDLLLAAIDAVANIRPQEAESLLLDLTESEDEDIVSAAHEAMAMAEGLSYVEFDEEDDEEDFDL